MTLSEIWIGEGPVLLHRNGPVATITLNRPEAANGMNIVFMKALHQAVMRCHREPGLRVVHLRGAGRNFCAGGDVREFAAMGAGLGDFLREVTAWLQMAVGALIRLVAVVVTEVQGFAEALFQRVALLPPDPGHLLSLFPDGATGISPLPHLFSEISGSGLPDTDRA